MKKKRTSWSPILIVASSTGSQVKDSRERERPAAPTEGPSSWRRGGEPAAQQDRDDGQRGGGAAAGAGTYQAPRDAGKWRNARTDKYSSRPEGEGERFDDREMRRGGGDDRDFRRGDDREMRRGGDDRDFRRGDDREMRRGGGDDRGDMRRGDDREMRRSGDDRGDMRRGDDREMRRGGDDRGDMRRGDDRDMRRVERRDEPSSWRSARDADAGREGPARDGGRDFGSLRDSDRRGPPMDRDRDMRRAPPKEESNWRRGPAPAAGDGPRRDDGPPRREVRFARDRPADDRDGDRGFSRPSARVADDRERPRVMLNNPRRKSKLSRSLNDGNRCCISVAPTATCAAVIWYILNQLGSIFHLEIVTH